jgi:hypothetical protein
MARCRAARISSSCRTDDTARPTLFLALFLATAATYFQAMRMAAVSMLRLALLVPIPGVFGAEPAAAEVRIRASPGGPVVPYVQLFEAVRNSGERVVIDGPCFSACTLVLSIVPEERICATRRAVLGFHAARLLDNRGRFHAEPRATRAVLETYPERVQQWIRRHGGLTSRLLLLRGRELAAMVPVCR